MARKLKFNFQLSMSNRWFYTLILIGILIVGGWVVWALTPGVAPNPGHTLTEVAPPAGCSNNQFLQWNGTAWKCMSSISSVNKYYATFNDICDPNPSNFIVTLSAFSPNLPAGTTVVPIIEVYPVSHLANAGGACGSVSGFFSYPGVPFSGTNPMIGIFLNAQINDVIRVENICNWGCTNGYSGNTTFLFVANV